MTEKYRYKRRRPRLNKSLLLFRYASLTHQTCEGMVFFYSSAFSLSV